MGRDRTGATKMDSAFASGAIRPEQVATADPRGPRLEPDSLRDEDLVALASAPAPQVLARFGAGDGGLDPAEAERRLRRMGPNVAARERPRGVASELADCIRSPLNALLVVLAATSWALGDRRAAAVIAAMILLSVLLAFVQEHRANRAAQALRALVRTHATVRRAGQVQDVPLETIVPGDLVELCAGDLVSGDLRLLHARDLHVNQASLTGEALPAEKADTLPHD